MRQETNKIQIGKLVGKYFIKLTKMNELISFAFSGSNATSIRVFIDLYSIKNTLLGRDFSYENDNDLCALILDMCVHYKNYFYSLGVTPIFYLIDSNNLPANAKTLYPAYNQGFAMKLTSGNAGFIEKNMEYLSILCPYLPNIHYIKTSFEASVVIADIALVAPIPNIVIGRDPFLSMLPGIIPGLAWIVPAKLNGADTSQVFVERNIFTYVQGLNGVKNSTFTPCRLGPAQLDKIYALTKLHARNLPPVLQYRTLVRILDENPLIVGEMPSRIYTYGPSICHIDDVDRRYQAISIPYQLQLYRLSPECSVNINTKATMYDIEGLKHINNYYFESNPLMLDDLLK